MNIYEGFHCHPTVCAVGNNYQIIVPVKFQMLFCVKVGDRIYYNHSNGIRISSAEIQRVTVPAKELDREKEYTVICKKMIERKPYRSVVDQNEIRITYSFKPIEKTEGINIYQIADAHGYIDETVGAAKNFNKDIDLLILNGDIANASDTFEQVITCYKIASGITEGTVPCIISRGNHDLRGKYAEVLVDHMPNRYGNSYYTFKVGCIWGILVDCGEDKVDSHEEYGETICCHEYRQDVTDYIKEIIDSKKYLADGINYRLVLSHVPFSYKTKAPFDIEPEIYTEWCRLLKENIKPDLLLSGHLHEYAVSDFGGKYDTYGQPCPVIIGSELKKSKITNKIKEYTGVGVVLNKDSAEVDFTSDKGKFEQYKVSYGIPE
ncbi:MAG: metallophosphoesterase [Clostridia bacterium]|nr:metallophosphoesterase [Clostridia bacterium]